MSASELADPVEHIADFVLYVMPGFIALQLYRAKYPVKGLSEFLQVSWCLIYGIALAGVVRWTDGRFFHGSLHSAESGFPWLRFIVALAISGLLLGSLLIGIRWARFELARTYARLRALEPDPQSIWAKVNRPSNEYAVVYLDDGSIYLGWIKEYTFDPDAESNDFLLADAKRVNEQLNTIYLINGQGVYLNTRNVKRIEFVE
ncbi:MAG TPA: DUF6338 family protein [Terriglobales bacterium]